MICIVSDAKLQKYFHWRRTRNWCHKMRSHWMRNQDVHRRKELWNTAIFHKEKRTQNHFSNETLKSNVQKKLFLAFESTSGSFHPRFVIATKSVELKGLKEVSIHCYVTEDPKCFISLEKYGEKSLVILWSRFVRVMDQCVLSNFSGAQRLLPTYSVILGSKGVRYVGLSIDVVFALFPLDVLKRTIFR